MGRPSTKKHSFLYSRFVKLLHHLLRHRCFPSRIAECLANASDSQKELVSSIDLHRILDIQSTTIELQLIAWILQNYNASNHSFVLHNGKVHNLTRKDVQLVYDFPDGSLKFL
ncbi:hypothetical protein LINGRAHAP2_LOCUS10265, partial [Linum grandiflorum]